MWSCVQCEHEKVCWDPKEKSFCVLKCPTKVHVIVINQGETIKKQIQEKEEFYMGELSTTWLEAFNWNRMGVCIVFGHY